MKKKNTTKPATEQSYRSLEDQLVHIEADIRNLVKSLNQLGFTRYMKYLQSKKKIVWFNFLAGMSYGFGIVFGMTVLVAIVLWVVSHLVDFPLIGEYFIDLKELLENLPTRPKFE